MADLRAADAEDCLPWDDGSYDAITLVAVLHHFFRPKDALSKIDRVLRPGGRVIFKTLRSKSYSSGSISWTEIRFPYPPAVRRGLSLLSPGNSIQGFNRTSTAARSRERASGSAGRSVVPSLQPDTPAAELVPSIS
ncbi:MAG: class I SAM-dependent methyltransferase [Acidobacteriia bacterium]|nr:class I SAM-dependent methyltransferase [Terriglobia bacterium]